LKEANEEIADILVTMILTKLALFLLAAAAVTSPEWGTCLLIGSASAGLGYLINEGIVNPIINKL
jgi:hypothetical protein